MNHADRTALSLIVPLAVKWSSFTVTCAVCAVVAWGFLRSPQPYVWVGCFGSWFLAYYTYLTTLRVSNLYLVGDTFLIEGALHRVQILPVAALVGADTPALRPYATLTFADGRRFHVFPTVTDELRLAFGNDADYKKYLDEKVGEMRLLKTADQTERSTR